MSRRKSWLSVPERGQPARGQEELLRNGQLPPRTWCPTEPCLRPPTSERGRRSFKLGLPYPCQSLQQQPPQFLPGPKGRATRLLGLTAGGHRGGGPSSSPGHSVAHGANALARVCPPRLATSLESMERLGDKHLVNTSTGIMRCDQGLSTGQTAGKHSFTPESPSPP